MMRIMVRTMKMVDNMMVMVFLVSSITVLPIRPTELLHTDLEHLKPLSGSEDRSQDNRQVRGPRLLENRSPPHRRVKRQLTHFFLTLLGKDEIQAIVSNTRAEHMPALIDSVGPRDILYIVSCLEQDQIMRVLMSLEPASIIKLSQSMTPSQLAELISYVPAQGLADLTATFTPQELQQLVVLLPPESVVNMTKALPPEHTLRLIHSMPPDALVNMTRSLPRDTLRELMTALPAQSWVPVLTSLPARSIEQLVAGLPPGFLESFVQGMTPEELGDVVRNVTDLQIVKLLTSFPVEHAPNVSSLLRPEVIDAVLDALPRGLVGNLTVLLPPDALSTMMSAVPQDKLLLVVSLVSPEQIVDMVKSIPSASWSSLLKATPSDMLAAVATSLPVDKIVNITAALAESPDVISAMISSIMSPDLITNFSVPFPREKMWEILEKLPEETIGKLAAAFPVKKAFRLAKSLPGEQVGVNITELLNNVPKNLLTKLATAVPSQVMGSLCQQLSARQLKKVLRLLTPDLLKLLMTSFPAKVMVHVALSLPEDVMSRMLQVLSPQHFRNLVKAVPMETLQSLVAEVLSLGGESPSREDLQAGARKVSNVLTSVPPHTLTALVKAIPRDVLVDVINALPDDVLARGAALLAGEEGGPMLMGAVPVEVAAYAVSILPPATIEKVVEAVPSHTLSAFGARAADVPQDRVTRFFQLIEVGRLRTLVTQLSPRVIQKLAGSLPPGALGNMARSISPVTVRPLVQSLRARDIRRLIRSVNTSTLTTLVTSIPQDVIVNLTEALAGPQLVKLMSAVPPLVVGHLVNYLHPQALVRLMRAMTPDLLDTMLTKMPSDLLVNMTRSFPAASLQQMIDMLSDNTIGRLVSILPADVMAGLVLAFDPEALLGMIQKLDPGQLMEILGKLPHQALLDMTRKLTPQQTLTLLRSFPPEGVANVTRLLPSDVMMQMMQALPPEALLGFLASMPLTDIVAMVSQLTPQQMAHAMRHISSDPDLVPNLLASLDLDRLVSMTEAMPFDLLMQMSGHLDVSKVKDLLQRLWPQARAALQRLVHRGLEAVDTNSSHTLHACLRDVAVVGDALLNFSLWAFHFLDATGRPGRGMLEGNIHMIGNYHQCKRIRHVIAEGRREGDIIAGSYCHVQFEVPLQHLPPIPGEGMLPMPEIAIDLCVPDSCKDFDIHHLLKTVELPLNVTIPRVSCQTDRDILQDPAALATCAVILILSLIVIVATVVDLLHPHGFTINGDDDINKEDDDSENKVGVSVGGCDDVVCGGGGGNGGSRCRLHGARNAKCRPEVTEEEVSSNQKLLQRTDIHSNRLHHRVNVSGQGHSPGHDEALGCGHCSHPRHDDVNRNTSEGNHCHTVPLWLRVTRAFSLPATLRGLCSPPGERNENVPCVHGIRLLSMLWVILANTVTLSALYFENLMNAANELISLPAQIIFNSSLSQDTFFLVSGVVTALGLFRSVNITGRVQPAHLLYYYLHRLLRIWPPYILVLMACACLLDYVADGPHWPPPMHEQCRQQWWTNLLFINNYFVSIEHMCMSWTWYLSNLMQFYWIAPLVLIPWALGFQVVGLVMAGLMVVLQLVSTALLELEINGDFLRRQSEYLWRVYQQPYCRLTPFAVGLTLGCVLTKVKTRLHISRVTASVGWALCLCGSSLLTLVTYDQNRYLLEDASGWSKAARALHETAQRPLWAVVISWVVFACSTGNGGVINKVLSWKGFVPLSRLSLCVYLVHPLLIQCDLTAYPVLAYFTLAHVVFRYVSYLVLSYLLALLLFAVTQSPALALERVVFAAADDGENDDDAVAGTAFSPKVLQKA